MQKVKNPFFKETVNPEKLEINYKTLDEVLNSYENDNLEKPLFNEKSGVIHIDLGKSKIELSLSGTVLCIELHHIKINHTDLHFIEKKITLFLNSNFISNLPEYPTAELSIVNCYFNLSGEYNYNQTLQKNIADLYSGNWMWGMERVYLSTCIFNHRDNLYLVNEIENTKYWSRDFLIFSILEITNYTKFLTPRILCICGCKKWYVTNIFQFFRKVCSLKNTFYDNIFRLSYFFYIKDLVNTRYTDNEKILKEILEKSQ